MVSRKNTGDKMMDKLEDFRIRIAGALADLSEINGKDPEATYFIGSLGADIAAASKAKSWSAAKKKLSEQDRRATLSKFYEVGTKLNADGKAKQSGAIHLLAISLVAVEFEDPQVRKGEQLLDGFVDHAVATYQKAAAATTKQ